MNLDDATKSHGEWKLKFRMAMVKKEQLDAAAISADNRCPLGQWLHGEAKGKYSRLASYTDCVKKHAHFHAEAGKVATLINQGKHVEAEAALSGNTPYSAASTQIVGAILGLRKEAAI